MQCAKPMSLHTPAAILQRIIYNANHTVMTFPPGEELAVGWGGVGEGVGRSWQWGRGRRVGMWMWLKV